MPDFMIYGANGYTGAHHCPRGGAPGEALRSWRGGVPSKSWRWQANSAWSSAPSRWIQRPASTRPSAASLWSFTVPARSVRTAQPMADAVPACRHALPGHHRRGGCLREAGRAATPKQGGRVVLLPGGRLRRRAVRLSGGAPKRRLPRRRGSALRLFKLPAACRAAPR